MSIQSQIDRINENVANTYSLLDEVGADIPEIQNTNNLPDTVSSIKAVLYGKEQVLTDEQKAQARENINAVSIEEVEELLGIEEEFSVAGGLVEFDLDIEEGTELNVVSKINRDSTWGESNKLVLHHVSGTNFVDLSSFLGGVGRVYKQNGITATINADSTLTIQGTNSITGWTGIIQVVLWSGEHSSRVYPAGTYRVPSGLAVNIRAAQYPGNVTISGLTGNLQGNIVVPEPFRVISVLYAVPGGATVDTTIPLGLFRGGSIPEAGYEYDGNVYTATFDNNVYEGEYNWTTGELKDTDGNTVAYYEPQTITRRSGVNYFWTGFGENTVSNVSKNNLEKAVITLGNPAPEETVPSICDFTLTPTTKNYSINLAGDGREFFRPIGNLFYGMEVPLVTTRGKLVVTNSDETEKYELTIPELINYQNITDVMSCDRIIKRWSSRFYITRDPDFKETVDDGSGNTNDNPNTIATWIFSKKEFEKIGLPIESTDIPIVSPVFTTATNDKLMSSKRSYAGTYLGAFSYDSENDNYVFRCRAREFYGSAIYKWASGYFCYPLKEEVCLDDSMLSMYMAAGYSVCFEQDDAFDVFWEYALTQGWCPFMNDSDATLWNPNTKPADASAAEYLIDTTPNVGIFIPRSIDDALYEAEHIAKRLNYRESQLKDYELNSYQWIGKGDGTTDYTDKIQSKLTEIHNTTNGGTIYLGPGTYPISNSLIVYHNTRIIGDGQTVIKQTADNTHALILCGMNIAFKDLSISLSGECTEITACVYANSNNDNGDNGYPPNVYVTNLTIDNVNMSGNYIFEYENGKPILGEVYRSYRGVGIMCSGLYFNYAHIDNVSGKHLMSVVYDGGGANYYNITAEFCKYAVYGSGGNNHYVISGHSYYVGNATDGFVSMSDEVVHGEFETNSQFHISMYDAQYYRHYIYFGGKSQLNTYTLNCNYAGANFSLGSETDNPLSRWVIDLGRANIHTAAFQNIPFAIGSSTRQISGLSSLAISDPAIRNGLSGAGVWGNISSNVSFNSNGLELSDVCRYPSERIDIALRSVASVISSVSASEDAPVEVIIDVSNRPITAEIGYFIQFDHRYVASDFTVSYDTNGDGTYNLSYEVRDNVDVTTFMIRHQDSKKKIYRIKFAFTKPLQIENYVYHNAGYKEYTINYNPDGLIGICNIGLIVNDYAGRSFLGECGGSLYGNVDMHQNTLKNLPAPVDDGDAVNKAHMEARLAEIGSGNLSEETINAIREEIKTEILADLKAYVDEAILGGA